MILKFLRFLVALVATLCVAGTAQALPLTFDPNGVAVISQQTDYLGPSGASYTYNFDVLETSTFTVSVTGLLATGVSWGDTLTGGTLSGSVNIPLDPSATTPNTYAVFSVLPPGQWALSVDTVTARLGGYFVGVAELHPLQVQSSVPEPETWAMMFAGLGTVGFLLSRTQSGQSRFSRTRA